VDQTLAGTQVVPNFKFNAYAGTDAQVFHHDLPLSADLVSDDSRALTIIPPAFMFAARWLSAPG
jgi:hypothetical protein